ncbi:hypothetical protein CLOSTMETH_03864 [[Clostridium] methylpentosum DSM 5476]|uniref:Uncharacterized protein n=1 Tax=[Clostridium] methylpentosum DSM 5476 TaxID=537013 RepID=C0EJ18_9FIRM|nr:hypothetical protein CLOSTMETH_03864 [[Clostridium] methylpentosum DSM 5476]
MFFAVPIFHLYTLFKNYFVPPLRLLFLFPFGFLYSILLHAPVRPLRPERSARTTAQKLPTHPSNDCTQNYSI